MEIWKPVVGFEGCYEISNKGCLRSLDRITERSGPGKNQGPRKIKGKIIKGSNGGAGYLIVALCKAGVIKYQYIHILVAKAFIKNPKNKPEVNHKDGDKKNNKTTNLEWTTHKGNHIHAAINGLRAVVKFTLKEVQEIKERLRKGEKQKDIANSLGASKNAICVINTGRYWGHVK